jgi:methylase of polypeptide subunit release factors
VATPIPDRAAAAVLGATLRRLGYVEEKLEQLLDEDAFAGGREEVLVAERRLPRSKLATAVRLLFLQLPVPEADVTGALGPHAVEALVATGLAEVHGDVVPQARIMPVDDVLLASDGFTRDADDPPDYVASYTPTARTCDVLTPRKRGRRALDVGTGSGIHALLAARFNRHVVAVDVNPRALAYTALNAALNGLDNVECRDGSFFDPAGDETYDLITCNAPFVVSPEHRWIYRDSDFRGDDLTAYIVEAAAEHLAPGGYATLLGSWLVKGKGDSELRPVEWVEDTGCDGWVLASPEIDPLGYAASWNSEFFEDTAAYNAVLDEWTAYLTKLGARGVAEGAILLHRRDAKRPTIRVDEIDEDSLESAGKQIRLAFANRARLTGMRNRDLLEARLARTMPLGYERTFGKRIGELALEGGTGSMLHANRASAKLVERLDGKTSLQRLGADPAAVSVCRELLELGALRFA